MIGPLVLMKKTWTPAEDRCRPGLDAKRAASSLLPWLLCLVASGCGSADGGLTPDEDTALTLDVGEDSLVQSALPAPQYLPKATGPCPEITEGVLTFSPDGRPRKVQVWVGSAAKTLDGPLVLYWHGLGSSPMEAYSGLGFTTIQEIKNMGGIVAAPTPEPGAAPYPWYYTTTTAGKPDYDIRLADEILACAIAKVGVDTRRIHTLGFSAGANQTMQLGYRRSGYIASAVTYSGAKTGNAPVQDPGNLFPAAIFHGGPTDTYTSGSYVVKFQDTSLTFASELKAAGHFAFVCNHGLGHHLPPAAGASSAWRFLKDHPFGTSPSPYVSGLPAGFPSYCQL